MSIFINKETVVIVQGITGKQGSFHTKLMLEYGTRIVAGVTPGKAGAQVEGIPVFDKVSDAIIYARDVKQVRPDYCVSFVPASKVFGAAIEAIKAGLDQVIISEHVPVKDSMLICLEAKKNNRTVIGPNCPGIISPGQSKIGIMPGEIFKKGNVGIVSRSGTLTYEIARNLSDAGIGQSTVIGIGGDYINGSNFIEVLALMGKDPETDSIVLIGEIGGDAEERAAKFIQQNISKPVVAFIAGKSAPPGKTMGHAGAIIYGSTGNYDSKIEALKNAGVKIANAPWEVATLINQV